MEINQSDGVYILSNHGTAAPKLSLHDVENGPTIRSRGIFKHSDQESANKVCTVVLDRAGRWHCCWVREYNFVSIKMWMLLVNDSVINTGKALSWP